MQEEQNETRKKAKTMTIIQSNSNTNDKPMSDACVEMMLSQDQISPLSPSMQDKPSLDISPISPTSAADVFLILDESLGTKLNMPPSPKSPFLNPAANFINADDDISLCCSEDDEMEEEEGLSELLGLSFVMEEDQPSQTSMEE